MFILILLQDIAKLYKIFPDDVLGSGQFGIVYGGKISVFYILYRRKTILVFIFLLWHILLATLAGMITYSYQLNDAAVSLRKMHLSKVFNIWNN